MFNVMNNSSVPGLAGTVEENLDLFQGYQAPASRLVNHAIHHLHEAVDLFLFVDDLDHDGQVLGYFDEFGSMDDRARSEGHAALHYGAACQSHAAGFEQNGLIKGDMPQLVTFSDEHPQ